ncbi:DUF2946 family protein [Vibrio rumoiensis]|uniref:DUF2946 family protein n=1 Tax=Vibrio rumoiensis TaxID=76258 RepID=A0ABW7IZ16_9VIBR
MLHLRLIFGRFFVMGVPAFSLVTMSFRRRVLYLPVVLILLIYLAPLVSMSVVLADRANTSHHMMVKMDGDAHSTHHSDHHSSTDSHHQHGWCGYCDLLATLSATHGALPLVVAAIFCLVAILTAVGVQSGRCLSYLFPTPRAPPVFSI